MTQVDLSILCHCFDKQMHWANAAFHSGLLYYNFRHPKRSQVSPKPSHSLRGSLLYRLNSTTPHYYDPWNEHKVGPNNVYINFMENCDTENTEGNHFRQEGNTGYCRYSKFLKVSTTKRFSGILRTSTWTTTRVTLVVWTRTTRPNWHQGVRDGSIRKVGEKPRGRAFGVRNGLARILLLVFSMNWPNSWRTKSTRKKLTKTSERFVFNRFFRKDSK